MKRYIMITGPQASGKTILYNFLLNSGVGDRLILVDEADEHKINLATAIELRMHPAIFFCIEEPDWSKVKIPREKFLILKLTR